MKEDNNSKTPTKNFIDDIIENHKKSGRFGGRVHTRFPPEPNGYLHIGHSKSICLNFGIALKYGGKCNLRFDDTNPLAEDIEFIEAIKEDVRWLGFEWSELHHASDYFDQIYDYAVKLIHKGKAYVCSLNEEEVRKYRGNLTNPGQESPYRNRSIEENLDLFTRMKAGEFASGAHTLRAKIDMASGNMNMRDPLLYRIRHASHPVTGDKWCIYPLYDFTHCLSDEIEGITHSICTLEFEDHRPLYDWILNELETPVHPQQIEFSKLVLTYFTFSKRKLKELVTSKLVSGWDDPRMPTLKGIRRRGFTPASLLQLCAQTGVSKSDSLIEIDVLEECLRADLNDKAQRRMAVLDPIKLVITNYPEGKVEELTVHNHPQKPELGQRQMPFSREVYIDREDFMEDPPEDYLRLKPGGEVRLRHAYIVKCEKVIKNQQGQITEIHCHHDPETLGKNPVGRKVKGIVHWVSAQHAHRAEVRLYDRLFTVPNPNADKERHFTDFLNPNSLEIITNCALEPALAHAKLEEQFQFERVGYFCLDCVDSRPDKPVFNRAVTLKNTWESK
ncbi:MAG: glutamine--tRNA ligase/YqeY domain fusion protein [Bdellovibrionales bacterium]|nr:glutamine--tRNA ligase/YqeY domain fusion protein [Bdellovibrionales bacterium]